MVKVLKISGYQKGLNTKYGIQDKIEGIAYENRFKATEGRETAIVWLNAGLVDLQPDCVTKDLYVEYGYRGSIQSCQIK